MPLRNFQDYPLFVRFVCKLLRRFANSGPLVPPPIVNCFAVKRQTMVVWCFEFHCCFGFPFFWLLSHIYLRLDFLQMGKVLFRILYVCQLTLLHLRNRLPGKRWFQYLSYYSSYSVCLLQVYLNPFPNAFLNGIFGTPAIT